MATDSVAFDASAPPAILNNHVQLNVPLPLSAQLLLQHCELAVQRTLVGRQLAAAAAVGAMIEETKGTLAAAAMPRRFIRARRDV